MRRTFELTLLGVRLRRNLRIEQRNFVLWESCLCNRMAASKYQQKAIKSLRQFLAQSSLIPKKPVSAFKSSLSVGNDRRGNLNVAMTQVSMIKNFQNDFQWSTKLSLFLFLLFTFTIIHQPTHKKVAQGFSRTFAQNWNAQPKFRCDTAEFLSLSRCLCVKRDRDFGLLTSPCSWRKSP